MSVPTTAKEINTDFILAVPAYLRHLANWSNEFKGGKYTDTVANIIVRWYTFNDNGKALEELLLEIAAWYHTSLEFKVGA